MRRGEDGGDRGLRRADKLGEDRERIAPLLAGREHPEIEVFVIATGDGDFHETIRTLREKGKQLVLWATRRSINEVYGESLRGPDRIQIEWLEDLVFGEDAAD